MRLAAMIPKRAKNVLRLYFLRFSLYANALAHIDQVRFNKEKNVYESDTDYHMIDIRRLAHIVEKGLLHSAWKPCHGMAMALELRNKLDKVHILGGCDDPSLNWAEDILNEYDEAQKTGTILPRTINSQPQDTRATQLDELIFARRSVRSFLPKRLHKEEVERVIEVINWSSTSCNRQPAIVYAVLTEEKISPAMGCFKGATNFSDFIPCFLVFCADLRGYSFPPEAMLPSLDVGLGIQNCALRAHEMGLSMTLLSWAQHSELEDKTLRNLLQIPNYQQIIVGASLGYPLKEVLPPGRKSINKTIKWI